MQVAHMAMYFLAAVQDVSSGNSALLMLGSVSQFMHSVALTSLTLGCHVTSTDLLLVTEFTCQYLPQQD